MRFEVAALLYILRVTSTTVKRLFFYFQIVIPKNSKLIDFTLHKIALKKVMTYHGGYIIFISKFLLMNASKL